MQDGEATLSVNIVLHLAPEDRERLLSANRAIQTALGSLHIYKCVILNHQDLIKTCEDILRRYSTQDLDLDREFDDVFMEIARKLLNLSASFSSYVDHQETHFSQTYGKASEVTRAWKAERDVIRDGSIAFPLMRDLRNYVQHVDLPPLHVSLSSNHDGHSFALALRKKQLLRPSSKWNVRVRDYISSHQGDIPLLELVSRWLDCFQALALYTNNIRLSEAHASAEFILNTRSAANIREGGMIGIWDDYPVEPTRDLQLQLTWLNEAGARQLLDFNNARSIKRRQSQRSRPTPEEPENK